MTYEEKEIYVHKFEKKHGIQLTNYLDEADLAFFNYWDYIFQIDDIIFDIDKRIKKGLILEWFEKEGEKYDFETDAYLEDKISFQEYLNLLHL